MDANVDAILNKYDILKMYFGEDYWVTDNIYIKQPTIGDILEYGEQRFFSMVAYLCANPTSMRLALWNQGINWNKVDDFELFVSLVRGLEQNETEILFGDLDFTQFETILDENENIVLVYVPDNNIYINKEIGMRIVEYLRILFDIHPKVEKARNKATAEAIIYEEEINLKIRQRKEAQNPTTWEKSILFPLISAALNHPGFKYRKAELKEVGIFEFMDSIKRLQIYEGVTSLMTGMYMGMIDTKKIDMNKELNWTRDIYE